MKSALSLVFACFLFFMANPSQAQEDAKIDLYTYRMIHAKDFNRQDINLFVRGDKNGVTIAAEHAGGYVKYTYGDISAVTVPVKKLDLFLSYTAVKRVENGDIPMQRLSDSAIVTNDVLPVHNGDAPLSQAYKGDGVIVGIIDDGVDIHHRDFRKANGDTRVKYLWDQNSANNNSPYPYGYGREWTNQDIDNGTCNYLPPANTFGHGTHVTGIACGNGNAANAYTGMAPNADIIEVAFNYNLNFLSTFVDAADYIFKKADAMGKPCVINASLGTYFGSHDGKDLAGEMIDQMLEERKGRSLVCALGNAGQQRLHLGYDVTADTCFTWFKLVPSYNDIYFETWADTSDLDSVWFSIGGDDPATNTYIGNVGFHNIKRDYNVGPNANSSQFVNYVLYDGTTFMATCSTQVSYAEGRYKLAVEVLPQNSSYVWRFITTGKGHFDCWSNNKFLSGTSDMVTIAPDPLLNPTYHGYKVPDTLETLVSSFTCSDKVISVGNFVNRNQYVDVYGDTIRYPNMVPGSLFKDDNPDTTVRLGSSYGPTRDGRLKPDISAPGGVVIAAGDSLFIAAAIASGNLTNYQKIAYTGKHYRNSGTSMASPMVAGCVALYLQQHPNASYREIKQAFISTARKDTFTGPDPNIAFGYGKLDCFQAMQTNVHYGCTDTAAFNFDSTANYDDGSCVSKVYGCMDVDAENYDPLANVADTCTYYVYNGVAQNNNANIGLAISPNPSNGTSTLYYSINNDMVGNAQIIVTDLTGRTVANYRLPQQQGAMQLQQSAKGVYIYYLQANNKVYSRKKWVVY